MSFEWLSFEWILTILTLLAGILYVMHRWWARRHPGEAKAPFLLETGRGFFPVLLAVLLIRSFVVEPFRIPSGSMIPTLLPGDFILVNKFHYGLRLPALHHKLISWHEPQRGDVVVFRFPENPRVDFIKRVIGVPGDEVVFSRRRLTINGKEAIVQPIGPYTGPGMAYTRMPAVEMQETLPGGSRHHVLYYLNAVGWDAVGGRAVMGPRDMEPFHVTVPAGSYFVMGDNRDDSDDSRRWGFVPEGNLVGKAFLIWMNWDGHKSHPLFERIGMSIG